MKYLQTYVCIQTIPQVHLLLYAEVEVVFGEYEADVLLDEVIVLIIWVGVPPERQNQ